MSQKVLKLKSKPPTPKKVKEGREKDLENTITTQLKAFDTLLELRDSIATITERYKRERKLNTGLKDALQKCESLTVSNEKLVAANKKLSAAVERLEATGRLAKITHQEFIGELRRGSGSTCKGPQCNKTCLGSFRFCREHLPDGIRTFMLCNKPCHRAGTETGKLCDNFRGSCSHHPN